MTCSLIQDQDLRRGCCSVANISPGVDLVVLGARGKLSQSNFTLIENVGSAQWTYICVTSGQGGAHFICFIKLLLDS